MKKIILFIFLGSCFSTLFSQEVYNKIIYTSTDSRLTSDDEKIKDYKSTLQEFEDIRKKLKFELIYTKEKSYFEVQEIDLPNTDESAIKIASAGMTPGYYYYKDAKTAYRYSDLQGECFKITQSFEDEIAWEITNETKKIMGFTCKKAIGGDGENDFTVWFTPELPHSYGPQQCHGLPGTVLEATIYAIRFTAVKMEKNLKLKAKKPLKRCREVTSGKFSEIIDQMLGR